MGRGLGFGGVDIFGYGFVLVFVFVIVLGFVDGIVWFWFCEILCKFLNCFRI